METIFKLYEQTKDPNFIGHDNTARDIFDLSLNVEQVEYDQENQTRYYEIIRWTVNHLASSFIDAK